MNFDLPSHPYSNYDEPYAQPVEPIDVDKQWQDFHIQDISSPSLGNTYSTYDALMLDDEIWNCPPDLNPSNLCPLSDSIPTAAYDNYDGNGDSSVHIASNRTSGPHLIKCEPTPETERKDELGGSPPIDSDCTMLPPHTPSPKPCAVYGKQEAVDIEMDMGD